MPFEFSLIEDVIIDKRMLSNRDFAASVPAMFLLADRLQLADLRNVDVAEYVLDDGEFVVQQTPKFDNNPATNPLLGPDMPRSLAPEYVGEDPWIDDPLIALNRSTLIFSEDATLKQLLFQDNLLDPRQILLLLAAMGISVPLPNFQISKFAPEQLQRWKDTLVAEREAYISAILKLITDAGQRLELSHLDSEFLRWARHEAWFSIAPVAREYAMALAKQDRKKLQDGGCWFPRGTEPVRRIISIEN